MVRIQIDGTFYDVEAGKHLLETCLALGFDIPYFCFHPALGSVGACRLCAVKKYANADDHIGRIVMSCMEQVVEGMIISTEDPEVKAFRASVLEGLMTNHPHDCPICDEGGECHLQDMTVMTGHNYRRYEFKKRTYTNQELGPFIQHEMNRCIQCYRCVRFYRNYAGGKDLNVFGSANKVYFGRTEDGTLENEFSGNLVEVCPTGVFTNKTLKKHYARKWDLTNAPSLCVHCSLGCNIIVSERYGSVRRVMNRYNGSVNGYFLCDRGRFGYEFINHPGRIKSIQIRSSKQGNLVNQLDNNYVPPISQPLDGKKMIGIGSPRASLESNFALLTLVGKDNFFHGIPGKEDSLVKKAVQLLASGIANTPSLKEIENCDAILILGEDITNTAPMMSLATRQAVRNKSIGIAEKLGIPKWNDVAAREMDHNAKSPLFIVSPFSTRLNDIATEAIYMAPDDIARLGYAIASVIDPLAPVINGTDSSTRESAEKIAKTLAEASNPLIITGILGGNDDILNATSNIANALAVKGVKLSLAVAFPECNSTGLSMLDGGSLDEAFEIIDKGKVDTLFILENDLFKRISKERAENIFQKCHQVIVLDHTGNDTTGKADILLPAATFAESAGTIINNEGRAQRFYSVLPSTAPVKESWQWIADIMKASGGTSEVKWNRFDDVVASLTKEYPVFARLKDQMPDADFRFYSEKIARSTMRFSGRTAMDANIAVSESKPPEDDNSPLNFSMEGFKGYPPPALTPYYWSPGWNSVQAVNAYMDEPGGHLKEGGDPGIKLFDNIHANKPGYFKDIPKATEKGNTELLFIPAYLIFGSEELSSRGEAITERIPDPFIILNEKEAERRKLNLNDIYHIHINKVVIDVRLKIDPHVPDGLAGLSCVADEIPYVELPSRGEIVVKG